MRHKYKNMLLLAIGCFTLTYIWYRKDYKINKPILATMEIKTVVKHKQNSMKYVLIWTDPKEEPIVYLKEARYTFVNRMCLVNNCYATSNRLFFDDITEFDVIIFHGKEVATKLPIMPKFRSTHQKYIYANMESSDYYPICDVRFDGYFNWTWTYKLDSDEYYGYVSIKDNKGDTIGPKINMHWMLLKDMDPINETIKAILKRKHKTVAWFVSNCKVPSGRDKVVNEIQKELKPYGLTVDIYGKCGTKRCPLNKMNDCLRMIRNDYYFYFAFENSISEDYVTEKLLNSLKNFAVPVVYGGANYTRFMPDGIYLDARKLSAKELVNQMILLMNNKTMYYDYFKWHKYYSYHMVDESPETDSYCKLCAKINDKSFNDVSIYEDFRHWWNPPGRC